MSSDVLTLGNLGNEKHKRFLRHISDIFDNHRGNISDNLAFTKFKNNSSNHTILFNTLSPDLDGKQLIAVDNDGAAGSSVLFAPIDVQSIICSDKRNNDSINILIDGKANKKRIWEAISDEKIIKLLIRLDESNENNSTPPPTIQGFSITFADSTKTKYRISVVMVNKDNEIISQVSNMDSSYETNNAQFFQFTNPVDGATRIVIDIELVGTNIFEWKLNNITLYSHMNDQSLRSLGDSGIITYTAVPNNVLVREAKDEILKQEDQGVPLKTIPTTDKEFEHTDSYGSPLVAAPNLEHQYFDNLQSQQITKIANIKRLFSTTDLSNGKKVYTFETNPDTKNLTLTFSPTDQINKTPDEPVYEMEQLVDKGYIKKGGFKNYCLTFFIKMDEITMQDQYLVYKYGGWLFNDQLPDLSRSTDIYIPIDGDTNPQVFTEYRYNFFNEIKEGIIVDNVPRPLLSESKWVGFQFIRRVDTNNTCIVDININKNPVDENGNFTNKEFESFLKFSDLSTDDHIANTWGGINEIISVSGSKYISLYGISLYELEW